MFASIAVVFFVGIIVAHAFGGAAHRRRRDGRCGAAVPRVRDRQESAQMSDARRSAAATTGRSLASSASSWSRCSGSATRWCRSTRRSARRPGCATSRSADEPANTQVDATRAVRIELDSNVRKLPWSFRPLEVIVSVHPGEVRQVVYEISNRTDHAMTGQAIPSYGPRDAAQYFRKLECFCFTKQTLQARRDAADAGRVRRRSVAAEGHRDDHAVVHVFRGRRAVT